MYFGSSTGYYRGTPYAHGEGSNQGQAMSGEGTFAQGTGPLPMKGWHPTVLYLFILVLAEMAVFGFLAKAI